MLISALLIGGCDDDGADPCDAGEPGCTPAGDDDSDDGSTPAGDDDSGSGSPSPGDDDGTSGPTSPSPGDDDATAGDDDTTSEPDVSVAPDVDQDGYPAAGTSMPVDCDDTDPAIHPGAAERCNAVDDDCDGAIDEDLSRWYYFDADADTWGDTSTSIVDCLTPADYVDRDGDCDDSDPSIYPGAYDGFGDGIDANCNQLQDWITLAGGNGLEDSTGDGGPATAAAIAIPAGIAVGGDGGLYVTDYLNRVRVITRDGLIYTAAGTGKGGYAGDGGPATRAQLLAPADVAFDAQGRWYIADTSNNRIRRVDEAGIITTVAGNGRFTGDLGDGGQATRARLFFPYGVGLDPVGVLYIADTYDNRVRRVGTDGVIETVAGNGTQGFSGDGGPAVDASLDQPYDVGTDPDGGVLIVDTYNNRIRRIDDAGIITTVVGQGTSPDGVGDGGPASAARIMHPTGLIFDVTGNLFIADNSGNRIRRVDPEGIIITVAGTGQVGYAGDGGPASSAILNSPWGLAIDEDGNLFESDSNNQRVRKVSW